MWVRFPPLLPNFELDGGLESQVADAGEPAFVYREVWFVKTRPFETTPQGGSKTFLNCWPVLKTQ